jgi:glycosyltransferase involved in cell wall biosynthesis
MKASDQICVAYDISILGAYFSLPDSKTGIFRVTEELLFEICRRSNLSVSLTSICHDAFPAYIETLCLRYCEERAFSKYFASCFSSRLGLKQIYMSLFQIYLSNDFQNLPRKSWQSLLLRGTMRLLSLVALVDIRREVDFDSYHLLHSTYFKLPPQEITGKLPRLLMIHDLIPLLAKEYILGDLDAYFLKVLDSINPKTDWIVCNSEYTRQEFCAYTKFPIDKTFVTYLAADSVFSTIQDRSVIEAVRNQYGIPGGDYCLCLASQLEPRKNIPHLVSAFAQLTHTHPHLDICLVLAGSLRYRQEDIENLLENYLDIAQQIILTGYVAEDDLPALYSGASAFVFPSLYEGFGLPVLEAMQAGTPVICSNTTSLPEVAGDAAILVDPTDKTALCQAMYSLLTDDCLRRDYIKKGKEQAANFTWKHCADETVKIYETIIENS